MKGNKKADNLFNSIEAIAGEPTERKEPPAASMPKPEVKTDSPPAAAPAPAAPASPFFSENENKSAETAKPVEAKPVLSEKAIEAAGVTGAFLAGGAIETVFEFTETIIFLTRFSKAEKERLLTVLEIPDGQRSDEDEQLNRKFLTITKKHEKIKEGIPLKEKDMAALENAFSEYTRATGKTLNPQLIVWSTIGKVFIDRAMDVFL